MKITMIFQFLEKKLQEFYKNPSFVTSCDDVIIDDDVTNQCQNMYSLSRSSCAKGFGNQSRCSDLRTKKSMGGGSVQLPPLPPSLDASRVKVYIRVIKVLFLIQGIYPCNKGFQFTFRIYIHVVKPVSVKNVRSGMEVM